MSGRDSSLLPLPQKVSLRFLPHPKDNVNPPTSQRIETVTIYAKANRPLNAPLSADSIPIGGVEGTNDDWRYLTPMPEPNARLAGAQAII